MIDRRETERPINISVSSSVTALDAAAAATTAAAVAARVKGASNLLANCNRRMSHAWEPYCFDPMSFLLNVEGSVEDDSE